MPGIELCCFSCKATYEFRPRFLPCDTCGNPLHVHYEGDRKSWLVDGFRAVSGARGLEKYRACLPVPEEAEFVSLGEGETPLRRLGQLNEALGLSNLFIKNESLNPSFSFKDRLNCVNASLAKAFGFRGIVATSTGNHGASAACYAAAAGLRCVVLFPHGTPDVYLRQVQAYGGTAVSMDWNMRGFLLERLVNEQGWFPSKSSLPAPLSNPFGNEGYKTISFELASQMAEIGQPDYVFIPVGSGDDYFGIFQGYRALVDAGLVLKMPTLVACEASGSAPLYDAVRTGADKIIQVVNPRTRATSISEGIVSNLALHALRMGDGKVCAVSEAEIIAAAGALGRSGIVAELSSCVAIAAVRRFVRDNDISPGSVMVAMVTATGLRWPDQIPSQTGTRVMIGRDIDVEFPFEMVGKQIGHTI